LTLLKINLSTIIISQLQKYQDLCKEVVSFFRTLFFINIQNIKQYLLQLILRNNHKIYLKLVTFRQQLSLILGTFCGCFVVLIVTIMFIFNRWVYSRISNTTINLLKEKWSKDTHIHTPQTNNWEARWNKLSNTCHDLCQAQDYYIRRFTAGHCIEELQHNQQQTTAFLSSPHRYHYYKEQTVIIVI